MRRKGGCQADLFLDWKGVPDLSMICKGHTETDLNRRSKAMAAGNWITYGAAGEAIHKAVDVDADSFRIVLVTDSYTPNQNSHGAWSDISAHEVAAGNGYATHGLAMDLVVSRTDNVITVDGPDVTWANSTITAKYAVIVRDANDDGTLAAGDLPIAYVDLDTGGGSPSSSNAAFTIQMNSNGIYQNTLATS
jgi:hypothetical protein